MRLWTVHPKYLDARGLVAAWREGLLAQQVLLGRTNGYRNHPQLERFRAQSRPADSIAVYLAAVCDEAQTRGYRFDRSKIARTAGSIGVAETTGQLLYEWSHLKRKLRRRNGTLYRRLLRVPVPDAHPMFRIVAGPARSWERMGGNARATRRAKSDHMRDDVRRMKWASLAVVALVLLATPPRARSEDGGAAGDGAPRWRLAQPDQIQWQDAPPSLPPGAKMAILEGDPAKDGFFAMRMKFPDGYRVMPHWHPNTERLTILQGVVHLGTGDRFDASATQPLAAGTYSSMPPKMTHFAWMQGETILQLTSLGPWQVVYVNPGDDPRNQR